MKKIITLICIAAMIAAVSSCKMEQKNTVTDTDGYMQNKTTEFKQFMDEEFQKFIDSKTEEKKAAVKKPKFSEKEAKKELEYKLLLDGNNEKSYKLQIGHFEIEDDDLELYALLADNDLITLSTKSIKRDGSNNYSIWADVALTSKGKKYISNDSMYDSIRGLDRAKFKNTLDPARDRNAYGELEEEPVTNPEIGALITNFYGELAANGAKKALQAYGEEELAEAYARINKLDSYMKVLEVTPQVPEKAITGGEDIDADIAKSAKVVKVTKYQNCYKVYFKNGKSVVLLLTPDGNQIFDLVLDADDNATIRTRNAAWADADIAMYANMAAAPTIDVTTEEDLGIEKVWYAPGLTLVGERDRTRYVYPVEKANSINEFIYVRLYEKVVDKIYNVKINTVEATEDKGNDYKYTANAQVVYKKVNITPFQLVLQKLGKVKRIGKADVYEKVTAQFEHFEDRAWGLVSAGSNSIDSGRNEYSSEEEHNDNDRMDPFFGSGIFGDWD